MSFHSLNLPSSPSAEGCPSYFTRNASPSGVKALNPHRLYSSTFKVSRDQETLLLSRVSPPPLTATPVPLVDLPHQPLSPPVNTAVCKTKGNRPSLGIAFLLGRMPQSLLPFTITICQGEAHVQYQYLC